MSPQRPAALSPPSLVAVSVLYNDPDFQMELPTPQQAHYQSQFSGSESESSDHDVAGKSRVGNRGAALRTPIFPLPSLPHPQRATRVVSKVYTGAPRVICHIASVYAASRTRYFRSPPEGDGWDQAGTTFPVSRVKPFALVKEPCRNTRGFVGFSF